MRPRSCAGPTSSASTGGLSRRSARPWGSPATASATSSGAGSFLARSRTLRDSGSRGQARPDRRHRHLRARAGGPRRPAPRRPRADGGSVGDERVDPSRRRAVRAVRRAHARGLRRSTGSPSPLLQVRAHHCTRTFLRVPAIEAEAAPTRRRQARGAARRTGQGTGTNPRGPRCPTLGCGARGSRRRREKYLGRLPRTLMTKEELRARLSKLDADALRIGRRVSRRPYGPAPLRPLRPPLRAPRGWRHRQGVGDRKGPEDGGGDRPAPGGDGTPGGWRAPAVRVATGRGACPGDVVNPASARGFPGPPREAASTQARARLAAIDTICRSIVLNPSPPTFAAIVPTVTVWLAITPACVHFEKPPVSLRGACSDALGCAGPRGFRLQQILPLTSDRDSPS